MTTSRRVQTWRRVIRILLLLLASGIPFVRIGGVSALRFDIPSLTLYFFGTRIGMDEFFLILVAVLFLGFLTILVTVFLGRIWCGWLCPQTVISDLTSFVDGSTRRGPGQRFLSIVALLVISTLLAAVLIWYFVSPYEFAARLAGGTIGQVIGWFWFALTVLTFLNFLFLRRIFCKTVCPYAKMQGSFFDERTLIIAADPARMGECMGCNACVRVCPVDVDVRTGVSAACINCAACIDACADRMEQRSARSLIGYHFGVDSSRSLLRRGGVMLFGTLTAAFLVLMSILAVSRPTFDLSVSSDPASVPRKTSSGKVVNTYLVYLTNRTGRELPLIIAARGAGENLSVSPEHVVLRGWAHMRVTVDVTAPIGSVPRTVALTVTDMRNVNVKAKGTATLLSPW